MKHSDEWKEADQKAWEILNQKHRRETIATQFVSAILSAAGFDNQTKTTHFIEADLATKKALEYADYLIMELDR